MTSYNKIYIDPFFKNKYDVSNYFFFFFLILKYKPNINFVVRRMTYQKKKK